MKPDENQVKNTPDGDSEVVVIKQLFDELDKLEARVMILENERGDNEQKISQMHTEHEQKTAKMRDEILGAIHGG